MKISNLFTKTTKDYPKDEVSASSQLLIRAGFIDKVAAGVYTLLPLGLKTVNKIANIIRLEMDAIGGQEIFMPALVPKDNLLATGRWESLDVLFKLKGQDEKEYGLGATHEEIVTPLAKKFAFSYRDLPFATYQIQNKFRNELRAKSGVLRTREFLMKDLYSFHTSVEDLDAFYERVTQAYWNIFEKVGIKDKTYFTLASGGTFSKYSHEFQTETNSGEDEVYVCKACNTGANKEIIEGEYKCPQCGSTDYEIKKMIEVGNIFKLKEKYSKSFDLKFVDEAGKLNLVQMGCYGIGIQRLMGAIAEVSHDERGLVWPETVAPYKVYLISIGKTSAEKAEDLYRKLIERGVEVLYDDREVSAGEKFADADLMGIPYRVVVSEKNQDKLEIKKRSQDNAEIVELEQLLSTI
jgi:prolyl-tRNA synthetase